MENRQKNGEAIEAVLFREKGKEFAFKSKKSLNLISWKRCEENLFGVSAIEDERERET